MFRAILFPSLFQVGADCGAAERNVVGGGITSAVSVTLFWNELVNNFDLQHVVQCLHLLSRRKV